MIKAQRTDFKLMETTCATTFIFFNQWLDIYFIQHLVYNPYSDDSVLSVHPAMVGITFSGFVNKL
ncbi:MAG: hypothetical protein ACTHK8_16465 [Ginsengibacter sp.]